VSAAAAEAQAGQVLVAPSMTDNTMIMRDSDSADGWLSLECADWSVNIRVFMLETTTYTLHGAEDDLELKRELSNNGSCPDAGITDQMWRVHNWGNFKLEIAGESAAPLKLTLIQEVEEE
jgi:hypothetical protein